MANRPYTQRETRLTAEFLALKYPHDRVMQQVRLGSPLPLPQGVREIGAIANMMGNYRRYADFLIIRAKDMILGETKVIAHPGIVSTLELYAALLRSTPELAQFKDLKLRKMLVWAVDDPVLRAIAVRQGIEVVVFTPSWVIADLEAKYSKSLRQTTPSFTPIEALKG